MDEPTCPTPPSSVTVYRARQKTKSRAKKTDTSSRWLGRRKRAESQAPKSNFDEGTEEFFRVGDSAPPEAPEIVDPASARAQVEDSEVVPTVEDRRRRNLAPIVAAAVVMSALLCVAALVRATERPWVVSAPSPKLVAVLATQGTEALPPAATVEEPAPVVPSKTSLEEREDARTLLAARRSNEAIEAGQRAVTLDPEDATAWLILGAAQLEASRPQEALVSFRSCSMLAKIGPVAECRAFAR